MDTLSGRGTYADADGFFKLEVGEGAVLKVYALGYTPKLAPTSPGREVVVKLNPKAVTAEEIVVSAERQRWQEEVGSEVRLRAEAVRLAPGVLRWDPVKVLQLLPGVAAPNDYTAALYVRGSAPSENLVLLDGAPLVNPFHMGGLFSTFMPDAVGSVDFWLGGFPARYGGSLASVLSVQSKEPERFGGAAEASFLAAQAYLGWSWGSIAARRTYFDKVLPLLVDFEFPYYFQDYQVHLNRGGFWATYFRSLDDLFFNFYDFDYYVKMRWGNALHTVGWAGLAGPFALRANAYQTAFRLNFDDGYTRFDNLVLGNGGKALLAGESWEAGLELEEDLYSYLYSEGAAAGEFTKTSWLGSGFGEKKLDFGALALKLGARLAVYRGWRTFWRLSPRLGGKYFLKEDLALKWGLGSFYQYRVTANPQEDVLPFVFFWLPLLEGQAPEEAWHFNLGLERWLGPGFTASAEVYYKHMPIIHDYRYYYEVADTALQNNFDLVHGYSTGLDILVKKDVGSLRGWLGYSFNYSMRYSTWVKGWYHPHFEKPHVFNAVLTKDLGRFSFSVRWSASAGNPYTGRVGRYREVYWVGDTLAFRWRSVWGKRNALRYPAYHRLDLGAQWGFRWLGARWSLSASVVNLYDRKNLFFYYYDYSQEPPVKKEVYQLPRLFSLGLRVEF